MPIRPNIIFSMSDDQRHDCMGCAGHPYIKSPVIDSLAEKGFRFRNAFVTTSICMASRANIFTGLTTTGHGYKGNPSISVLPSDIDTSFPTLLRKAGYRTAFYGKQHVSFQEGKEEAMSRMFDSWKKIVVRNANIFNTVRKLSASIPAGTNYTFRRYYKRDFNM